MSKDYGVKSGKKKNNLYTSGVLLLNSSMDLSLKISKMLDLPENVVKKVLEVKEQNPKQNYEFLAKKISNEIDYILQADDIKEIVQKARELLKGGKQELQELNEAMDDIKKYDVIDDHYVIYTTKNSKEGKIKEMYKIPVGTVDKIFNDYSRHGANMSGQAIMTKYKLKVKARQLIKSNIGLYKDSHILSPLSLDIAESEGKVDEIVREVSYSNFEDKNRGKFKEAHTDTLEKVARKYAKTLGTIDGFMEYIAPLVNGITPLSIQVKKLKDTKIIPPMFVFADPHLGKKYTDSVVGRLYCMADDIIAHPSKKVKLVCLGDIFEALMQGGMHSGQIETMDGIYGADLFMYGVEVFVGFLKKILEAGKEIEFVGIGGNHDRISTLNDGDNERMFATIFYEMLKSYLQKAKITFDIIRKNGTTFDWQNTKVLPLHEGIEKKNPEGVAWKYGDTDKHMIIISAHEHNEQIYTGRNVTHYKVNAMAGSNDYDERLGKFSYPGYAVFEINNHNIPDIYSKRLP